MTLSRALLLVAALTAVLPILSTKLRPPESVRDLEKSFVVAIVALGVGTVAVWRCYELGHFGMIHLMYLLAVVTIPGVLGGWYLAARFRGTPTKLLRFGGAVALAIALCGVWGTHIEPNWLRTDRASVTAPVSQPIVVGVLSDLQTPNVGAHEQRAIDMLLAEQPDIVVVPGDLFQGNFADIAAATPDFVALLKRLADQAEVVAIVTGDSDTGDLVGVIASQAGALFIENEVLELTIQNQRVRLAGVSVGQRRERLDTLAALRTPSDAFTMLVAHRPDAVYDLPPSADVDLIVSGHTHGGQISVPLFGPPVTLSNVPRDIAAGGIGLVNNYPVYVSTGVGLERSTAPQVRFGVRPSVGIITVTPPTG